jgi:hypothetical protein
VVNFQSYDELLICSDIVKNQWGLLQDIYSAGNAYNSSIVWVNSSLELNAKPINPVASNTYTFSLQDISGNLIELNGSEWSFVLCLFKVSDFEHIIKRFIEVLLLDKHVQNLE